MIVTAVKHRCPRVSPGLLLLLLLAVDCHALLFRPVERGPCQAKNPFGPGFSDGACMPVDKCKETLRGIIRLNFPVVCGVEILTPIVCCPLMNGHGPSENREPNPLNILGGLFGKIPGSSKPVPEAGLNIGGGPSHQGYPGGHGLHAGNEQGHNTGTRPHHQDSLGGQNGKPTRGNQGQGTGSRPQHQGSQGSPKIPTTMNQGPGTGSRPQNQGSQGSHKMPTATDQGQATAVPSCGQSECPPPDTDDIIHLIDPRTGKS